MINPALYRFLERTFGEGNVKIVAEDEPMSAEYKTRIDRTRTAAGSKSETKYELHPDVPGEEYHVSCPYCNDTRGRLYINHRWGVKDDTTGTHNLWLAQCYNEMCLSEYSNQAKLRERVYGNVMIGPSQLRAPAVSVSRGKLRQVEPPGVLWPMHKLARKSPNHHAVAYLEDRLIDPSYVGRRYGVSYCVSSDDFRVVGRIVAPAYVKQKLVGWQARFVGDPPSKSIPKWLTATHFRVGSMLYDGDHGLACQTKIVVEGPADVWGFGTGALGAFRNGMTQQQREMLANSFEPGDVVVVMLDPEQNPIEAAKRRVHHIEKLFGELQRYDKLRGRVLKVYLPGGLDPGEADRRYMRDLILLHAEEAKLPVKFGKPKVTV